MPKPVGQKDISTVAFNIVLHTIFFKLIFELERVSRLASLIIVMTIALSYIIIAILGGFSDLSLAVDPDLVGIGQRSIFNINTFILLMTTSCTIAVIEQTIKIVS